MAVGGQSRLETGGERHAGWSEIVPSAETKSSMTTLGTVTSASASVSPLGIWSPFPAGPVGASPLGVEASLGDNPS